MWHVQLSYFVKSQAAAVVVTIKVFLIDQFQKYQIQNKQPKVGKHIKVGNMDVWAILIQIKNLNTLVSHDLSSYLCSRLSTDHRNIVPENPKLHNDVNPLINENTQYVCLNLGPPYGASFKNVANADE